LKKIWFVFEKVEKKYDLFLKKSKIRIIFYFQNFVSKHTMSWETGIRDLGVERVGAFGQKTNFVYSYKKGIGIPLIFE
jgi:hypothetical protein